MIACLVATACGCHSTPPASDAEGERVLTGVVIRKQWSKSLESWSAGGSEYYVLKVTGAALPPEAQTAKEGCILLPSDSVSFDHFQNFVGVPVTCRGRFVGGNRYIPPNDTEEQLPASSVNPITGDAEYPVVGAGFKVRTIDSVVKK